MKSVVKRVLAGLAVFLGMFMVLGVIAIYPAWKTSQLKKAEMSLNDSVDYYKEDYQAAINKVNKLTAENIELTQLNTRLKQENTELKQENVKIKSQISKTDSAVNTNNNVSASMSGVERAEKLARQIAADFMVRDSLRDKIIYEDYSPVTNEQNYCENSKSAKDILSRSGSPNGTVYALTEYDKNGYFIVFGKAILGNQTLMSEAVIHEMAHVYCAAKNLDQGPDEHSAYYKTYYQRIWDYAYYKYPDLL